MDNGGQSQDVSAEHTHRLPPVNENEEDDPYLLSLNELLYSAASFHAIVKPVTLTMILSALSVIYINTNQSIAQGQAETNVYKTFGPSGGSSSSTSNGQALGLSLANAFVIVAVICALTFVIVLLYKYRCMKCLVGYMILSSAVLLGFLGYQMFKTAVDAYRWPVDMLTTISGLFNFAAVGTWSIFFSEGIPSYITQGYLIATSVLLAWQLSNFDAWTAWALLVMLALYDLFAVLTPCGPLKALVELMGREDAPNMPGLLYEANLPAGVSRRNRQQQRNASNTATNRSQNEGQSASNDSQVPSTVVEDNNIQLNGTHGNGHNYEQRADRQSSTVNRQWQASTANDVAENGDHGRLTSASPETLHQSHVTMPTFSQTRVSEIELPQTSATTEPTTSFSATLPEVDRPTGKVPLAIAKMYRLQLVNPVPPIRRRSSWNPLLQGNATALDVEETSDNVNDVLPTQYSPHQLRSEVEAYFPRNGGRIVPLVRLGQRTSRREQRYAVMDRQGNTRRILYVNHSGRIFEERQNEEDDNDEPEGSEGSNSIKLGLGDFIFYSVLVSKAAQYSFATFCACTLVILAGLGATLVLLAVYGQALPALPISIFLGVFFYLVTRVILQPFIEKIFETSIYV